MISTKFLRKITLRIHTSPAYRTLWTGTRLPLRDYDNPATATYHNWLGSSAAGPLRTHMPSIQIRSLERSLSSSSSPPRPPKAPGKKMIDRGMNWRSFLVAGGIVAVLAGAGLYYKNEKELELAKRRRKAIGKAAIGGRFELVDPSGQVRKSEDFYGKWLMIYFGFTHCPDVCPDEIEKMIKVVDMLDGTDSSLKELLQKAYKGQKPPEVLPLFITVDPDRDSKKAVGEYCKEFSPKLIGLTGTKEQIDLTTRGFRVYYSAGPRDESNDYIVDHTIIMYLIDPEGNFVDYYGQTRTAEQIANAIMLQWAKWDRLKGSSKSLFG